MFSSVDEADEIDGIPTVSNRVSHQEQSHEQEHSKMLQIRDFYKLYIFRLKIYYLHTKCYDSI